MEILKQIREENQLSMQALEATLNNKREQIKKMFKYNKSWNKIKSNLILSVKQQLMSSYHNDDMSVQFDMWYIYEDIADNLNNSARSSYYDMSMEEIESRVESDRLDFGVWITVDQWRDDVTKNPAPYVVDPLSWRPDPLVYDNEQNARWHWFITTAREEQLKNDPRIDKEALKRLEEALENPTRKLDDDMAQWQWQVNSYISSEEITLYNHYTIYEWKYMHCVTDEAMTELLMSVEIEQPKAYKKVNRQVRPINITWLFPKRGMPFGYSLPDLLEDKQDAKDLLLNLKKLRAKKEAMGWDILIDINYVDPYQFSEQKEETRIHPIDPNDKATGQRLSLDSMIHQPQQERFTFQLMDSMAQDIDQSAFLSTGVSAQSLWVPTDKSMTATESQTVQMNSNVRIRLGMIYQKQAQKRFWMNIWYRSMLQYLSDSDKKYVNINTGLYTETKIFSRSDIITNIEPRLSIVTASEEKLKNQQEFAQSQVFFQWIIADPNIATWSKRQVMRRIGRLLWYKKLELEAFLIPADPKQALDESVVREHVVLINNGEMPYMSADEDHVMFKFFYQRCEDSPTKAKAIWMRDQFIMRLWQQQQAQPQWQWMMNSANNIMMSQLAKPQQNSLQPN